MHFEQIPQSCTLRKGKWTTEEETYASKIIQLFNRGMLNISSGTTLRSYLSEKLNCDPMRITKKFAGASCIGKQVFQPCDNFNNSEIVKCEEELRLLEESFLARLLGKETTKVTSGATFTGRSSGRARGSNNSNSNSNSNSNRNSNSNSNRNSNSQRVHGPTVGSIDDGYLIDEDDDNDRVKPILVDTYDWLLTHNISPSKRVKRGMQRVMSAPTLSSLQAKRTFRPLNVPTPSGKQVHLTSPASQRSPAVVEGVYAVQSRHRSLKRTLSSMGLEEYESYSRNDQAAGDLLLQFVLKVKEGIQEVSSASEEDSSSHEKPAKIVKKVSEEREHESLAHTHSPFSENIHNDSLEPVQALIKEESKETINVVQRHYDPNSPTNSFNKSPIGLEMDTDDSSDSNQRQ